MRRRGWSLRTISKISASSRGPKSLKTMLAALYAEAATTRTMTRLFSASTARCLSISHASVLKNWQSMTGCAITAWHSDSRKDRWLSASFAPKKEELWNPPISSAATKSSLSTRSLDSRRRVASPKWRKSKKWPSRTSSFKRKSLRNSDKLKMALKCKTTIASKLSSNRFWQDSRTTLLSTSLSRGKRTTRTKSTMSITKSMRNGRSCRRSKALMSSPTSTLYLKNWKSRMSLISFSTSTRSRTIVSPRTTAGSYREIRRSLNRKRPPRQRLCTIGCIIAALCGCRVRKWPPERQSRWTNWTSQSSTSGALSAVRKALKLEPL